MGHNRNTAGGADRAARDFSSVTDGTSNTMMLAECAGRNLDFYVNRKQDTDPATTWSAGPWANPASRLNIGGCDPVNYTNTTGPMPMNCVNDKEIYSFHTGGAYSVFGDGSVRFLNQNVSLDVLLMLLTRARGDNPPNY